MSGHRYLVDVTRSIRAAVCMRAVVEHDMRTWLRGWFSLSLATDTARRRGPNRNGRTAFLEVGRTRGLCSASF